MAERYFTPAEVEALIPALTRLMGAVMDAQAEVTAVRGWLQAEQERIGMAGGGMIDQRAWRENKATLERFTTRIRDRLEEIARLGGSPKDLGLGLVDFPHLRHGQVVNLCWKHGEQSIGYWHGLDEGFASRKPL